VEGGVDGGNRSRSADTFDLGDGAEPPFHCACRVSLPTVHDGQGHPVRWVRDE
jgi:hypothetical protein